LWLRIAKHYPISFINDPLTVYTDNPHGVSTDSLVGRLIRLKVLEKDYLKDSIPSALYRKRLAQNYQHVGRHFLNRGKKEEGKRHLRHALALNPINLKNLFYYTVSAFK